MGALPAQLRLALADEGVRRAGPRRVKLYNASNFFEPRAVPPADLAPIAELLQPFAGVTVESHPRLVGGACAEFAGRLSGRLEVAMGLETIHPRALPRLGKQATLDDFSGASARLRRDGIGVRAFVLVGAPFVPVEESVEWAVRSAAWAVEQGADVVALIPLRATGDFTSPSLRDLEAALEGALRLGQGVILADLWDAARLPGCAACRPARIERLARMSRSGRVEAAIDCESC